MNLKIACILAVVPLLSACAEADPVVSDFNGDSVKIQQSTIMTVPDASRPEIVEIANKTCGAKGRKAQYASSRVGPNAYYSDHLFLCL